MRQLTALACALALSLLLYVAVFSVVHRPLTLGEVSTAIQARRALAASLPSAKLAVWAGSNGRYSHRCEVLSAATGLPCVNLSLAMGIGLDFQMQQYEPLLKSGDVVYLPLEYSQYRIERDEMQSGAENPALVHEMRDLLWTLGPRRIARAYGHFDLPYLVHGLLEMGLVQAGVRRRATAQETTTPQGDMAGHGAAAAIAYQGFLRAMRFDTQPVPTSSHALAVLDGFLQRAQQRGVFIVGGLPTVPDNVPLDEAFIGRWQAQLERHGHRLLILPNRSQYPLTCFFDTLYHLHEGCQLQHSAAVGSALAGLLQGTPAARAQP